jgi:hypothetical protein
MVNLEHVRPDFMVELVELMLYNLKISDIFLIESRVFDLSLLCLS